MGQENPVPRRINKVEGAAGEALLSGGPGAVETWGAPAPAAHEGTHVAAGADDIDSALAIAAMADLTSTMIWQGNVGNRPVEVAMPAAGVPTMEFFVPVTMVKTTGEGSTRGDFATVKLSAVGHNIRFSFKCPHDFSVLTHCKVIVIADGTGTIDWTVTTDFGAIDENYNIHSDTDTQDDLAMTDLHIEDVDISNAFTNLAADDYIGVWFTLDADTIASLHVIGIVFKYS